MEIAKLSSLLTSIYHVYKWMNMPISSVTWFVIMEFSLKHQAAEFPRIILV